ncbi:hypothetical protein Gotri_010429 [Gossypium trilobum]|uniref:BRI1 kinase inhibitor 1 n=1 Tax=Gossypium trilobum TaxID=34281 RepID=A0A7J9ERB2_9ROSI|nr:hypothetical protein [Gossypium trilobum]
MNGYQQQKTTEQVVDRKHGEGKLKQEPKEGSADKQSPPASPPSAASSPSHEFSFTVVSLHSSSNNEPKPDKPNTGCKSKSDSNIRSSNKNHGKVGNRPQSYNIEANGRPKSKSFTLFGLTRWHHKGRGIRETEEKEKHKTKMRFDLRHVLKRYVRMVRPLLFFRGRRDNWHLQRQSHSFSGNLSWKNKEKELRARKGRGEYYSAPASMRTSPTNSGLLVATTGFPSSTSDSTMEELQAAIQAAIAHCKNSIQGEDKFKC